MPEILNEEDDGLKIFEEAEEEIREYGRRTGVEVSINERKSPVVIFNPPRYLVEQAKRVKQETKKETD